MAGSKCPRLHAHAGVFFSARIHLCPDGLNPYPSSLYTPP